MGSTDLERLAAQRQRDLRRSIGREIHDARLEANLSIRRLSTAAGLHHSHLPRVEAGDRSMSQDALVSVATALGYDVSFRLFRSAGPRTRDRI